MIEDWPPAYTLVKSQRARYLSLKISATKGLEVVLPDLMNENCITPFLQKKKKMD